MSRAKNPLYWAILAFNLVLLAVGAALCVFTVIRAEAGDYLRCSGVLALLAMLSALYYVLRGYSKRQAWAYKCFIGCSAAAALAGQIFLSVTTDSDYVITVVLLSVIFALLIAMAVSKDVGKRNSLILAGLEILLTAVLLGIVVLVEPDVLYGEPMLRTHLILQTAVRLVLAVLLFLITWAKYIDKEARHGQ